MIEKKKPSTISVRKDNDVLSRPNIIAQEDPLPKSNVVVKIEKTIEIPERVEFKDDGGKATLKSIKLVEERVKLVDISANGGRESVLKSKEDETIRGEIELIICPTILEDKVDFSRVGAVLVLEENIDNKIEMVRNP